MRKGFWGTPAEAVPALLDALDHGPAAVVFGPEPHGPLPFSQFGKDLH